MSGQINGFGWQLLFMFGWAVSISVLVLGIAAWYFKPYEDAVAEARWKEQKRQGEEPDAP